MAINVYTAKAEELQSLEQVGPKVAQEVIELQNKYKLGEIPDITLGDLTEMRPQVNWRQLLIDDKLSLFNEKLSYRDRQQDFDRRLDRLYRLAEESDRRCAEIQEMCNSRSMMLEGEVKALHQQSNNNSRSIEQLRSEQSKLNKSLSESYHEVNSRLSDLAEDNNKRFDCLERVTRDLTKVIQADQAKDLDEVSKLSGAIDSVAPGGVYKPKSRPFGTTAPGVSIKEEHIPPEDTSERGRAQKPHKTRSTRRRSSSSSSSSDNEVRDRSKSPPRPKLEVFAGDGKCSWHAFISSFKRIANRRGWSKRKCFDRLFDSLSGKALEYADRCNHEGSYKLLKKELSLRFDSRDAPVAARQKLHIMKQDDGESLEDYLQRVLTVAMDGFSETDPKTVQQLATESFLRGCRHKEAAAKVLNDEPRNIQDACRRVKSFLANQKAIHGTKVNFKERAFTMEEEQRVGRLERRVCELSERLRERSHSPFSIQGGRYRGEWGEHDSRERSPSPYMSGARYRSPSPYRVNSGNSRDYQGNWSQGRNQSPYRSKSPNMRENFSWDSRSGQGQPRNVQNKPPQRKYDHDRYRQESDHGRSPSRYRDREWRFPSTNIQRGMSPKFDRSASPHAPPKIASPHKPTPQTHLN